MINVLFKRVVKKEQQGLRWLLTLSCGHVADAVNHQDTHVVCMACMGCEDRYQCHDAEAK